MKLPLTEYGGGIGLDELAASSPVNITSLLEKANAVIQRSLGIRREALSISNGKLRALGIAGTIRIAKDIELEIVPKMLGASDGGGDWKTSLFLLAALSRYGNIITDRHIHSSTAYQDSLYDIAGRILAREYSDKKRKLVRQYRRERFCDFAIDGEIDFDTVFEKNADGISQSKISFDRINPYNATIQAAMRTVLPYVRDASTRQIIVRAVQELGAQSAPPDKRLRVPARNREWAEVYGLSYDILRGMGSSLEDGAIMSPGFIVDTWRIWEWLITVAMRIGLGNGFQVIPQASTALGTKWIDGKAYPLNVFPDVAVFDRRDPAVPAFLADAKYKLLPDVGPVKIDRADLYEAFAFCHATGAKKIFLVYPAAADSGHISGSITRMADYKIGDITILVVKAAFGSVSKQGDLTAFCRRMAAEILDAAG